MCKELKKNNNTSHIPLIFLTAKTSDIDKIEGLNTGAADYIVKPFDPNELKIKVGNILADRKKSQDRLRKDFILNPAEVKVESPEEIFLQQAVRIIEEHMGDGDFNLVNNLLFNWWNRSVDGGDHRSFYNIINNYLKPGPVTPTDKSIAHRFLKPEGDRSVRDSLILGKAYVHGNIAEGYCRRSAKEYLNFLNISLGSCGELNSSMISFHRAELISDDEFDPFELEKGINIEFEHTDDYNIAKAIAKDHLAECDSYYTRLERMERECEKDESLEKEAELTISDDELDDEDLEDLDDEDE